MIESDPIWDIIEYVTCKYMFRTSLVIPQNMDFAPYLLITIPVNVGAVAYIMVIASDIIDVYENNGRKCAFEILDKNIEAAKRKYGLQN